MADATVAEWAKQLEALHQRLTPTSLGPSRGGECVPT